MATDHPQDTDRDTDAVTLVAADEAAHLAGVSVRTVRRWIQRGWLPSVESEQGKLVSPADLAMARARGGHGHGRRRRGHDDRRQVTATAGDTVTDRPPSVSPAAVAQLEAIRDQWLAPLVEQIQAQAETIGRLTEAERRERDRAETLARARDELAARVVDERALADQLVDILERERDALRWERDRLTEQLPAERASWQHLAEVTVERDRLLLELEQARAHEPSPAGSSEAPDAGTPPPAPDVTFGKTWWRRLRRGRMGRS